MQSKIIFVVLFMLTFTVMHGITINIMHKCDQAYITHYVSTEIPDQECRDIHEAHSIFHFVGLIMPYKSTLLQLQKEKTFSYDLLQYTLPYKDTSYKPPIA